MPQHPMASHLKLVLAPLAAACFSYGAPVMASGDTSTDTNVAVAPATCGPGSHPETGLQGQVPLQDRLSGRSQKGYACNLEMEGQYQGERAAIVSATAGHCVYMPTSYGGISKKKSQGVQVIDVSDPSNPKLATSLDTRAFHVGTWESLKVNAAGTMLAGAGVALANGSGKLNLNDVSDFCPPQALEQVSQHGRFAAHNQLVPRG